jgi:nucleotide-binding universal stress UspA family protein
MAAASLSFSRVADFDHEGTVYSVRPAARLTRMKSSNIRCRRSHAAGARDIERKVGVGAEITVVIFELDLATFAVAAGVVELRQHHGLAELAVVDHVACVFVIGIKTYRQARQEGLIDANVVIVGASGSTGLASCTSGAFVVLANSPMLDDTACA